MAGSSLGFQNIFTFGKELETGVDAGISVVEIWMPYDNNVRMAADSDPALIEAEGDKAKPCVKPPKHELTNCPHSAEEDSCTSPNQNTLDAATRNASSSSVKSTLNWDGTALTTPYSEKENPIDSVVFNKFKTDSPQREVQEKRLDMFKDCYWCRSLRRPLVFFCFVGWFILSLILTILLILCSQHNLEGAETSTTGKYGMLCNGKWSEWSHWQLCLPECGGQQSWKRTRSCQFQENRTEAWCCPGQNTEITDCSKQNCGLWSQWTDFSRCSHTCGRGLQKRIRDCLTGDGNGTSSCFGNAEETRRCNERQCPPVDGGWSPWQLWSECSQSCGRGMHTRKRLCTHPNPQNGGFDCWGNSTDTEQCNTQDCPPVDGQWSPWLNWGACSVTCGGGTQIRVRSCTKPAPQWGGKTCQGQRGELQTCSTEQCPPVHGNWSAWTPWTSCSRTCGLGVQSRMRSCTNPTPEHGGTKCTGLAMEYGSCRNGDCPPVDGSWAEWSSWTSCSDTCGGGTQVRTRTCTNPPPSNGGQSCSKSSTDRQDCNTHSCPPVNGAWGIWGQWSQCSQTCGVGLTRQRTRKCNSPTPQYGGKSCSGDTLQEQACNVPLCPTK